MDFIFFASSCTLYFGSLEMFSETAFLTQQTDLSSCCHSMDFSEQEETQCNKYGYYNKMPLRFLVQIIQLKSASIWRRMSFQRHCTFELLIISMLCKLLSTLWKKFYFLDTLSPKQSKMINAACYWWALQHRRPIISVWSR